jgi:ATP-binding cassette, subfamily C, bacterial
MKKHFVLHFLEQFMKEEYVKVFCLFATTIVIQLVQTKGISETSSKLIDAIHHNKTSNIMTIFYFYAGLLALMLILYYIYYSFENRILTKLKSWARHKMLDAIIKVNHDTTFSDLNFTKLNSPIHRVADLFVSILARVISNFLPNAIFLLVISAYFFQISPLLSSFFLIGNIVIGFYYYYFYDDIINKNVAYENKLFSTDSHLIDVLNNMDKIVYRGQSAEESQEFFEKSNEDIESGIDYFQTIHGHNTTTSAIVWFVLVMTIWYMLQLLLKKQMTPVFFVTSFTILLVYKEKLEWMLSEIPDTFGFIGRIKTTLSYFTHLDEFYEVMLQPNRFKTHKLEFREIEFKNVDYKYKNGSNNVFEDRSYYVKPIDSKIIGITGPSGRGKSTFIKLLLKMYDCDKGNIFIDGVNLKELDPLYVRQNITYVNQNAKLFDKKVVDNMLYGCGNREICDYFLKRIMEYPNISKLYKNMDIKTKSSGMLGENLSGGQRQVVNMIGGLVNPSRILVIDEPTNALDPALKKEVILMIKEFSQYKQAVFIITHDKDVFKIFDEELRM